jgi:glucose/arabinose dehydrogenase
MGPRHGDELNLIQAGENYGWPMVSNGDNYSGIPIPDHDTRPEFNAPEAFWVPAISPAGFVIYDGDMFPDWRGDGFIGGLSSQALVRVDIDGDSAGEAERFEWGKRVREVEQGPDGALWVLEDKSGARLLKLTPAACLCTRLRSVGRCLLFHWPRGCSARFRNCEETFSD